MDADFSLQNKKPPTFAGGLLAIGATGRNRTPNLLITNQLLCQLSYGGTSIILIDY